MIDIARFDTAARAQLTNALGCADARILRRCRNLVDFGLLRLTIGDNQVGKRAANIDAN